MALINKLSAIGNAIREKTGKTDLLTLDQMPQEIKGIETGSSDNYYDTFWNAFFENGERTDFSYAFYGSHWNDEIYPFDRTIKPINGANLMFAYANVSKVYNVDLSECTIGFSCQGSTIKEFGLIDCSKMASSSFAPFPTCRQLEYVEKIIFNRNIKFARTAFSNCDKLTHFIADGEIGSNFYIQYSPLLTTESVSSIISALIDLTGVTGQTIQFHANVKAKLTETQIASITSKNWTLA